jgi:hypothetical protein
MASSKNGGSAQAKKASQKRDGADTKSVISAYMSTIGSKGGKIGGKRRLKTMSPEERKKAAQKAARARWQNRRNVADNT